MENLVLSEMSKEELLDLAAEATRLALLKTKGRTSRIFFTIYGEQRSSVVDDVLIPEFINRVRLSGGRVDAILSTKWD